MDVLKSIAHLTDTKLLAAIESAAKKRLRHLLQLEHEKNSQKAWDEVKHLKPGQEIFVCADGMFLGGPFQRGDKLVVHVIQSRKKLLWAKVHEKYYYFGPKQVLSYKLRPTPPDKPIDPHKRKLAETMGEAVEKVFGGEQDAERQRK